MVDFSVLDVWCRQRLGFTSDGGHPPQARGGILCREHDGAIRSPACAAEVTRYFANRRRRTALHRDTLQQDGVVQDSVVEPNRDAIRRKERTVHLALGHKRFGGELVYRTHVQPFRADSYTAREIGNELAVGRHRDILRDRCDV